MERDYLDIAKKLTTKANDPAVSAEERESLLKKASELIVKYHYQQDRINLRQRVYKTSEERQAAQDNIWNANPNYRRAYDMEDIDSLIDPAFRNDWY